MSPTYRNNLDRQQQRRELECGCAKKMTVAFEELEAIWARIAEINAVPFADIEWTKDGVPLNVSPKMVDDWRFVGMSNATFPEFYPLEPANTD